MADIYVRSTDGSDADNGSTWALAKASAAGADAIDAAGDRIFLSDNHNESQSSAITLNFAGTLTNPTLLLSVDDSAEPPTALLAGAAIKTSNASTITLANTNGGGLYAYGITFAPGNDGGHNVSLNLANTFNGSHSAWVLEECTFRMANGSGGLVQAGPNSSASTARTVFKFVNCVARLPATTNRFALYSDCRFVGGSVMSGAAATTGLFRLLGVATKGQRLVVEGFDFSNLGAAGNLVSNDSAGLAVFRACKLPTSWSGTLIQSSNPGPNLRVEMYNCDNADTNYRLWISDYFGDIITETTYYRTGGASDGTTSYSLKMTSTANCAWPTATLQSNELVIWNDTTGSSVTVTCEIEHAGVGGGTGGRLTDREAWLEVVGLGTSGYPLGSVYDDACADVLTAAADQADSSESWAGSLGSAVKQKLAVSFTPQEKGWILCRVHLAKPSVTIYIDPELVKT